MARSRFLLAAVLLLVAPGVAFSQEAPKYTYLEAGYIDFDPEGGLSDDGWFAGGSLNLFRNFHLMAEYGGAGDYTTWSAGFGWHGLLGESADLFAEALWNDLEYDSSTDDFSDDGYEIAGGVRWKIVKWFEVKGKASWVDYGDGRDDMLTEAQALFLFMNDRLGIGASYEGGDADTLKGFLRFNFGN